MLARISLLLLPFVSFGQNSSVYSSVLDEKDLAKIIAEQQARKPDSTIAEELITFLQTVESDSLQQLFFTEITAKQNTWKTKEKGYFAHEWGNILYRKYKDAAALKSFLQAIEWREKALPKNDLLIANSHYMASVCQLVLNNSQEAIKHLKKASAIYKHHGKKDDDADCLARIGQVYRSLGEYESANLYYQNTLAEYDKIYFQKNEKYAEVYWAMSLCLGDLKEFLESKKYAEKAYQIYQKNRNKEAFRVLENIAWADYQLKNYEKANQNYQLIYDFLKKDEEATPTDLADTQINLALVAKELNQFELAEQYLQKAGQLLKDAEAETIEQSNYLHNYGVVVLKAGKPQKALDYFQQAMQLLIADFQPKNASENPDWTLSSVENLKPSLLTSLQYKAAAQQQIFVQTNKIDDLKNAYQTYQSYSQLIDYLREDAVAKNTKLFWLSETYPVFEAALQTTHLLYQKKHETEYAAAAFNFMEKNKAVLLFESLQKGEGNFWSEIPDSLRQKKSNLQEQITELKRQQLKSETQKPQQNQEVAEGLIQKINEYELQLLQLENQLKEQFKNYRNFVSEQQFLTLDNFQKKHLKSNQAAIEYFVGEEQIFVLGITKNQAVLDTVSILDFRRNLELFIVQIQQNEYTSNPKSFATSSYRFYQKLAQPILQKIATKVNELIIVPDGQLAYLPFDVLLTEEVNNADFFGIDLPFLLKKYAVNYANSLTVFSLQKSDSQLDSKSKLFAFAPSFSGGEDVVALRSCNTNNLYSLQFNQREVEQISNHFTGQMLQNTAATVVNFKQNIGQSDLLHLATHACVDDENPEQSRIYFTDDFLYAHEIYNLKIPAKMVVLSACETGVGAYQKGEGMMSLARGFSYAGVPALTTSLWSVNDETTAELMGYFYENLAAGEEKHVALQKAKLTFLQAQNRAERLSPFYWAGFVQYGKTTAVAKPNELWKWGMRTVLISAFLGLMFWWKKKRQ